MSKISKCPKMVVTQSGVVTGEDADNITPDIPQQPIDDLVDAVLTALQASVKSGLRPEIASGVVVQLAADYCRATVGDHTVRILATLVSTREGADQSISSETVQ